MAKEKKHKNYEESDAQFRGILWSGIALFALMLVAFLLMGGLFKGLEGWIDKSPKSFSPLSESQQPPSEPLLQVDPELDLVQYNAIEDSVISTYGWIQKEAGVVRIPVEEAMKLMLERGFPVRPDFEDYVSKNENGGSRK